MNKDDVLIAITTFGSPAYVSLNLQSLKKRYNHNVVVLDDGSKDVDLIKICYSYNVPLIGCTNDRTINYHHSRGDMKSTVLALKLANLMNKKMLLKVSRRFIWIDDPIPSLLNLEEISNGWTFSFPTYFGFNTYSIGMKLPQWNKLLPLYQDRILNEKDHTMVQFFTHNNIIVPHFNQLSSEKHLQWYKKQNYNHQQTCYTHWQYPKIALQNKKALWHERHNIDEYLKLSQFYNLSWKNEDFKLISYNDLT